MLSYHYRDSHVNMGIPILGKTVFILRRGPELSDHCLQMTGHHTALGKIMSRRFNFPNFLVTADFQTNRCWWGRKTFIRCSFFQNGQWDLAKSHGTSHVDISGLMQERHNSIANNALEFRLSCTNLSICCRTYSIFIIKIKSCIHTLSATHWLFNDSISSHTIIYF